VSAADRSTQRACQRAGQLLEAALSGDALPQVDPPQRPFQRRVVIGDPQTTAARLFALLEHNDLLGPDGLLRPEVSLLSIGDHFDFKAPDGMSVQEAGREGLLLLAWLTAHAPEQVRVLAGNHDLCRVMELHRLDDADFAAARAQADPLKRPVAEQDRPALEAFHEAFPDLPSPGIATKDFSCFLADQRTLIQRLLLAGRLRLAQAARLPDGREALLTHAGVTLRELGLLDPPAWRPINIASRLNALLCERVADVRPDWIEGRLVPLDLGPTHVSGVCREEGGGLLYHRPANPERDGDKSWESRQARRFDPRALPQGLVQVCGHTQHKKELLEELGPWANAARELRPGALRLLHVRGDKVVYEGFPAAVPLGAAELILVDGSMNSTAPADYELLELRGWVD
jgi:hypothetical protein